MIKLVCFLKRKDGLTREEFYDHWENRHGPLIAGTPELARHIVRYEQLRVTTVSFRGQEWRAKTGKWKTSGPAEDHVRFTQQPPAD